MNINLWISEKIKCKMILDKQKKNLINKYKKFHLQKMN